ncbi:MAG: hypothetical protein ACM3II_13790 [Rhodospirillaceae bacterium]
MTCIDGIRLAGFIARCRAGEQIEKIAAEFGLSWSVAKRLWRERRTAADHEARREHVLERRRTTEPPNKGQRGKADGGVEPAPACEGRDVRFVDDPRALRREYGRPPAAVSIGKSITPSSASWAPR